MARFTFTYADLCVPGDAPFHVRLLRIGHDLEEEGISAASTVTVDPTSEAGSVEIDYRICDLPIEPETQDVPCDNDREPRRRRSDAVDSV
jgi:hypothetical protein